MAFDNTFLQLNTNYLVQNSFVNTSYDMNFLPQLPQVSLFNFESMNLFDIPKFTTPKIWDSFNSFKWQMPTFSNFTFELPKFSFSEVKKSAGTNKSFNFSQKINGNINNSYLNLSKSAAYQKAKTDSNLEELSSGNRWQISKGSFVTDIPFAKKGTAAILDKVTDMIGENLTITSALGTGEGANPHQKGGYSSHHNAENPKLDISTRGKNANLLAQKLKDTGYFTRVSIESTHLDVQIDPKKFNNISTLA